MSYRDLRPIGDGIFYFNIEEAFESNPAAFRTSAIFTKPGDREDFIALIEFKERLAPKDFAMCLVHPGEERGSLTGGGWSVFNVEQEFYGKTLLEAVRRARAHTEGDPELLP